MVSNNKQYFTYTRTYSFIELLYNGLLNTINDITNVIINYVRSGRQTEAHLEEVGLYFVSICNCISIYRLFVHWFPNRTAFYLL